MKRHVGLSITVTTIILISVVYAGIPIFNVFHPSALPMSIGNVDAHTRVVVPLPGVALPEGLHAGEHIDLAEQSPSTRAAMVAESEYFIHPLPPAQVYRVVVERDGMRIAVPVRTIGWDTISGFRSAMWMGFLVSLFEGAIALAVVWRGRDRAAVGLALFVTGDLIGRGLGWTPSRGVAGLVALLETWTLYLLARVGFYIMAESIAGAGLSARARRGWRAGFLVLLGAGALVALVGPVVFVTTGWGFVELLQQGMFFGLTLGASYLISVALLFVGYHRAEGADRARLRWMLWGGGLFAVGIIVLDVKLLGPASFIASHFAQSLGLVAFLYAILRHRVVDVKVVISRTLVYAMTTSLVLGLFALFESLFERTALGHRASLVLELALPLGLGVSLSTVHRRIDTLVDRLIFRRQYREEVALRRFANESAFVNHPETLLDLAVEQLLHHVGAPWVAFYEYTAKGYRRVRQRGEVDLPQTVATDDLALVKLRAHESDVDLHEAQSGLGRDGYAFPLRARGHLLGVLVIGPRPGEHYAAEERELMAHVAHAVGASLFALRARTTEEELSAARSEIETSAARLDATRAEAAAQLEHARAQGRVSEALLSDLRARESVLLDALRALGSEPRVSTERKLADTP